MATLTKEDIVEAVGGMSLLEVADLVKMFEEKFGVSAAAPVAVSVAGGAAPAAVEEKTDFDVRPNHFHLPSDWYKTHSFLNFLSLSPLSSLLPFFIIARKLISLSPSLSLSPFLSLPFSLLIFFSEIVQISWKQ